MWGDFLDIHLENAFKEVPKVVRFAENGLNADQVAKLVVNGAKRANSFSLLGLQYRNEPLPHIGDFMVATGWEGNATCMVRTTAGRFIPFVNLTEDYAWCEGYANMPPWKKSHWQLTS